MRLLLIFVCACRFHWDARPAPQKLPEQVTIVLDALDESARANVRAALRDPRVVVVDVHAAALAAAKASCGGAPCEALRRAGCTWAAQGGAQYFALALAGGQYAMHDARTCEPIVWPPPPPPPPAPDVRHAEIVFPIGPLYAEDDDVGDGGGVGIALRCYPRAGGMRFGMLYEVIVYGPIITLLGPEIGYGIRVHPLLQLSANLALARAWASDGDEEMAASAAPTLAGLATLRVETYFAWWVFLGADIGYRYSGTFDRWDNPLYEGREVQLSVPTARFWFGVDF